MNSFSLFSTGKLNSSLIRNGERALLRVIIPKYVFICASLHASQTFDNSWMMGQYWPQVVSCHSSTENSFQLRHLKVIDSGLGWVHWDSEALSSQVCNKPTSYSCERIKFKLFPATYGYVYLVLRVTLWTLTINSVWRCPLIPQHFGQKSEFARYLKQPSLQVNNNQMSGGRHVINRTWLSRGSTRSKTRLGRRKWKQQRYL